MKIEKLKPGMTVYDVHAYTMGNTKIRSLGVWPIRIISIDLAVKRVTASWNSNSPRTYGVHEIAKWKETQPFLISGSFGQKRRPTREELAAHKAKLAEKKAT